jgi:hypothetical protein
MKSATSSFVLSKRLSSLIVYNMYTGYTQSFYWLPIYRKVYSTIPPPPGGTAILPEYIHYYGYYYQVIVQCLSIINNN